MIKLYLGDCKFFFLNLGNKNKVNDQQERSCGGGGWRAQEASLRLSPRPQLTIWVGEFTA